MLKSIIWFRLGKGTKTILKAVLSYLVVIGSAVMRANEKIKETPLDLIKRRRREI